MSYHILHQFDEQWVADNEQEDTPTRRGRFFRTRNKFGSDSYSSRTKSSERPWLIVGASLIIAACALYFAMDARRQTVDLQHRLTDVESRLGK